MPIERLIELLDPRDDPGAEWDRNLGFDAVIRKLDPTTFTVPDQQTLIRALRSEPSPGIRIAILGLISGCVGNRPQLIRAITESIDDIDVFGDQVVRDHAFHALTRFLPLTDEELDTVQERVVSALKVNPRYSQDGGPELIVRPFRDLSGPDRYPDRMWTIVNALAAGRTALTIRMLLSLFPGCLLLNEEGVLLYLLEGSPPDAARYIRAWILFQEQIWDQQPSLDGRFPPQVQRLLKEQHRKTVATCKSLTERIVGADRVQAIKDLTLCSAEFSLFVGWSLQYPFSEEEAAAFEVMPWEPSYRCPE